MNPSKGTPVRETDITLPFVPVVLFGDRGSVLFTRVLDFRKRDGVQYSTEPIPTERLI